MPKRQRRIRYVEERGYLQVSHARVEKRAGVQSGCSPHHSTDTIEVASENPLLPICKMPTLVYQRGVRHLK